MGTLQLLLNFSVNLKQLQKKVYLKKKKVERDIQYNPKERRTDVTRFRLDRESRPKNLH